MTFWKCLLSPYRIQATIIVVMKKGWVGGGGESVGCNLTASSGPVILCVPNTLGLFSTFAKDTSLPGVHI